MKGVHVVTNFTAGEMSPKVRGRVDIAQFNAGARQLRNAYPVITGGAVSRVGTVYCGAAKYADRPARMVPFVVDKDVSYAIEFGEFYMRFYRNNERIAPEVTHYYSVSQIFNVDYAQDGKTMYMAHELQPIKALQYFSSTQWAFTPGSTLSAISQNPVSEIGLRSSASLTLSATSIGSGRTATASGAVFMASDVGRAITLRGGILVITAYTDSTHVTGDVTATFDTASLPAYEWTMDASPQTGCTPSAKSPVGASITLTLAAAGWRTGDVGSYVRINGGLCKITGYTSDVIVSATIISELSSTTAAPALAWQLLAPQWNSLDGYPRTITFHQQRLVAASSTKYPQTIWGSRVGEPSDYVIGTSDSDPYAFTLAGEDNNQIRYVTSSRHLMALTYGAEYSIRGQAAKSVISTANPPDVNAESNHGCNDVRPARVRKEVLFAQRAGREVRGLGYRYDFDGYDAPNLSALADHLFGDPEDGITIVDMAFQQRPHSLLWVVRSDGLLASLTIDRTQSVIGWALHEVTGGAVESVCCVPGRVDDVVYLCVRRTVDGATVRYIEAMEAVTYSVYNAVKVQMQLDCSRLLYDSAGMTTAQHTALPNTEVQVVGDGAFLGTFVTDATGTVTLPRSCIWVQIGLAFESTVEPNSPEDGSMGVAAIGQRMSTSRVTVRTLDTGPIRVNGQLVENRNFGSSLLDQPPPVASRDVDCSEYGWSDGESPLVITRDLPFPMHILAVIRDLTVNQG